MAITRRTFLKLGGVAAAGLASGAVYGYRIEPEWLQVEQTAVAIPNLPAALDGFKIVLLSDFHLYPFTQLSLIEEMVTQTNALNPDLVVLTGDFVLETAESIFDLAPALAGINAKHGVFSVLGNHDHWTNAVVVQDGLAQARLPLLLNEGVALPNQLYLAGVDDGWSGQPDLAAALAKAPRDAVTVLLSHEPDFANRYLRNGRVALQLSGHSHGGQVRLPGYGPLVLPTYGQRYPAGLYSVRDGWVYTTRGIGVVDPPVRVNCPPEISELILTRA